MDEKCKNCKKLKEILNGLVDMYVANKDTATEFISCITPEKRTSHTWLLWTRAIQILKDLKNE